ncbi:MAG: hypothetical protein Q7T31_03665 [Dietzia sp.]|uniref:hypothetical protein n=1 Tax=Dietzia sp. TaxID=1871616 RepID=UPI002716005C|nr:hypothetical protein [Dietzia sp.]MDO8393463.1 hypothetical protein [Dietzia sp.]
MTVSLELLSRGPSRPDLLEDLVVTASGLATTLSRWSVPDPVEVPAEPDPGLPVPDAVAAVLAADTAAVIDVAPGLGGQGPAADRLVDLLALAAHSGVGFGSGLIPRCTDAAQVWALLAGAVAAMTGGDVRSALSAPDPAALVALSRSAREAIRDVVTCVLVPEGSLHEVSADLASARRR